MAHTDTRDSDRLDIDYTYTPADPNQSPVRQQTVMETQPVPQSSNGLWTWFKQLDPWVITAVTLAVSVPAFSLLTSISLAAALCVMLLLLAHEHGHGIEMRRQGMNTSGAIFIPFLGAVIISNEAAKDAYCETRIGLAGPVAGTLATCICFPVYFITGEPTFLTIAFFSFMLNLFNLIPIQPLDGGRAASALSPWLWFVGVIAFGALAFFTKSPIIIVMTGLFGWLTWTQFKAFKAKSRESRRYYRVTTRQRIGVSATYVGLFVALVGLLAATVALAEHISYNIV